jgi:predicted flap endonuclease-1-like 5' DNA nuclease
MPDLTLVHFGLIAAALLAGVVLGWIIRSGRSKREKLAVNAGWQAQIDSQQSEHDRLAGQNKSLMEQISQYQASNKDAKNRAKELSDSIKDAFSRRDEMQRQMKDIRTNLEVAVMQRDKLKSNANSSTVRDEAAETLLKERDNDIANLKKELANWQDRVPPLVERYRQRDLEAQQLEIELQKAIDHIATLESMARGENTRIEPVDSSSLPDGLDASNEPHTETSILAEGILDSKGDERIEEEPANDAVASDSMIEHSDINTEDDAEITEEPAEEVAEEPGDDSEEDEFSNIVTDGYDPDAESHDNLKKIKGVGPAIEKTLNGLGIYRFNQIAEMSEYDIDRVAQQLKGFRSRIYREDWVGQARTLQYEKNNP